MKKVGLYSPEAKARWKRTLYWNRRLAFIPLFLYLVRYGGRSGQVARMRVSWWTSSTRTIGIRQKKRSTKTQLKEVVVDELMGRIIDACCEGKAGHEYIFTPAYVRGDAFLNPKWTNAMMNLIFKQVARSCGLPGTVSWLRHTSNTNLCERFAGSLRLVADVAGYKRLDALQRYIHVKSDKKRMIADYYTDQDARGRVPGQIQLVLPGTVDAITPPDQVSFMTVEAKDDHS